MAAKVIVSFLPDLVAAISDCVQPVSDQCLAKGLIPDSVYKRVLESGGTSEDKARTLILAVKKSTETDSRCLEILLHILAEQLPYIIKDKLLSEIREELKKASAVVPSSNTFHLVPVGNVGETAIVQNSLLGRLEDAIRQHEHACTEKNMLEKRLKAKMEECVSLRSELEALKSQNDKATTDAISDTQTRITGCESEINNLEVKFSDLEKTIEEQGMQVRRGRNTIIFMTGEFFKMALQEKDTRIQKLEADRKSTQETYVVDSLKQKYLENLLNSITKKGTQAAFWMDFGKQLGFNKKELDDISSTSQNEIKKRILYRSFHYSYDREEIFYLAEMLRQWLLQYPGDSRGSTSFATYSGLQNALVKTGLRKIARDLIDYSDLRAVL